MHFRITRALNRGLAALVLLTMVALLVGGGADAAGPSQVALGTAAGFAVLAGSTVTSTGASSLRGELGLSPGTAVTGFPPGTVSGGVYAADSQAMTGQTDATTAYRDAAGLTGAQTVAAGTLGGQTLTPGVYRSASSLALTGNLVLDAQGDAGAVFIFQAGSTLTTASGSTVTLSGGAQACNVFWQVGSSATLGTGSVLQGTILALTSITADVAATVYGRLLAQSGAVTLDANEVTVPSCAAAPSGPPTATIGTPAGGGTYTVGQVVPTSFSCQEATGGPGIATCLDSHGAASGSGALTTSTPGTFTYTVTATSKSGQTGTASIQYTVVAAATGNAGTPGATGNGGAPGATGNGGAPGAPGTVPPTSTTGGAGTPGSGNVAVGATAPVTTTPPVVAATPPVVGTTVTTPPASGTPVVGLPHTGGAPPHGGGFPWVVLILVVAAGAATALARRSRGQRRGT